MPLQASYPYEHVLHHEKPNFKQTTPSSKEPRTYTVKKANIPPSPILENPRNLNQHSDLSTKTTIRKIRKQNLRIQRLEHPDTDGYLSQASRVLLESTVYSVRRYFPDRGGIHDGDYV